MWKWFSLCVTPLGADRGTVPLITEKIMEVLSSGECLHDAFPEKIINVFSWHGGSDDIFHEPSMTNSYCLASSSYGGMAVF